jgi:aspartyl-tRNA(Asn)/glutamyl-tRNA(Gln) amidotransferase subunit B
VEEGKIGRLGAKKMFQEMFRSGAAPDKILQERGLAQIGDAGELAPVVERVIAENAKAVADFRSGRQQSVSFLVGQVMRVTRGRADPQEVQRLLLERLQSA